MSGGVDSSVAAALLSAGGYEVIGLTLQTWVEEGEVERPWLDRSCCKIGLARHVAERLGIAHHVVDARAEFRDRVVRNFLEEYAGGRTPNPCVLCNERVKFGLLLRIAREMGAELLATGHYARVDYLPGAGRYRLRKGVDPEKDQSYFLYRLGQEVLSAVLFPLGGMHKRRVWEMAEDLDLPADQVAESQEICFVNQGDHGAFLKRELPQALREGEVVDPVGRVLGRHPGVALYTVGQRRGLGLAASGGVATPRRYVVGLNAKENQVVVGPEPELYHRTLSARQVNLTLPPSVDALDGKAVTAKIRYRSPGARAVVKALGGDQFGLTFEEAQRAVTPGQSVVLYDGDVVLGGGIIDSTRPEIS